MKFKNFKIYLHMYHRRLALIIGSKLLLMIIIPNCVWATLLKPLMNLKQAKYGRMPVTLVAVHMLKKVCNCYSLAIIYHSLYNILIYVYPILHYPN